MSVFLKIRRSVESDWFSIFQIGWSRSPGIKSAADASAALPALARSFLPGLYSRPSLIHMQPPGGEEDLGEFVVFVLAAALHDDEIIVLAFRFDDDALGITIVQRGFTP
jgi:hypothetical protein